MSFWGSLNSPKCNLVNCFIIPILNRSISHHTNKKRILSSQRIGPHNYDILCVIFGSLLGDSHAEKRVNATRICFQQESSNVDYLHHIWKIFNDTGYCSDVKPALQKRIGPNGKIRFVCRFKTFTYGSLNWIHEAFYINGVKVVPTIISDFLSPLALAIWIMDDGVWAGYGVRIATNSLTLVDVQRLCEVLNQKYGLVCSAVINGYSKHEGLPQYNLYIQAESIPTLRKLVKPFFVESMFYKLGL